jgi:hypothetical protein
LIKKNYLSTFGRCIKACALGKENLDKEGEGDTLVFAKAVS